MAIGKLNDLAQLKKDIQFAVCSCARLSTYAKHKYWRAIEYITRYLEGTANLGITLHPKQDQCSRVYANDDFSYNWLK